MDTMERDMIILLAFSEGVIGLIIHLHIYLHRFLSCFIHTFGIWIVSSKLGASKGCHAFPLVVYADCKEKTLVAGMVWLSTC